MARRLFLAYLAIVFGPLLFAAAAFALHDLLGRRRRPRRRGDGRAQFETWEHTVEEVRAP